MTPEDGTKRLFRNFDKNILRCIKSPKVADLIYTAVEASNHAPVAQYTKETIIFRYHARQDISFLLSSLPTITRLKSTPLDRSNKENIQHLQFREAVKNSLQIAASAETFIILTCNDGVITLETEDKRVIFILYA